jgi:hypothetical protein
MLKDILQSAQNYPAITAVVLIFIGAMIVIGMSDVYVRIFKWFEKKELLEIRQQQKYEEAYSILEDQIRDCKLTALSEALIKCELKKIALMPGNDKEKTGKLCNDYLKKFYGVSKDELDEHSPENLDFNRVRHDLKIANESRLAL